MDTGDTFRELEKSGTTMEGAFALFDRLDVVTLPEMIGRWKGNGFHTGHEMDGALETYCWYGKEFIDPERVHPLLFTDANGGIFIVDPRKMKLAAKRYPILERPAAVRAFQALKFLVSTERPQARLRMIEYRGKVSGTMIYDDIPVLDHFRKVDSDTLLGAMDQKGMERPLFFVLRRDAAR